MSTLEERLKLTALLSSLGMDGVAEGLRKDNLNFQTSSPPSQLDHISDIKIGKSGKRETSNDNRKTKNLGNSCQMCGVQLRNPYKLRDHYTNKHFFSEVRSLIKDEKRSCCQFCGKEFDGGPNLIFHMVRHVGSTHKKVLPFVETETENSNINCDQCKICKKKIQKDTSLGLHLVNNHFKTKLENLVKSHQNEYECYICNSKTRDFKEQVNHVGIYHGRAMKWYKEIIEPVPSRKKINKVCHICGAVIAGAGCNWRSPLYTHLARRHFSEELLRDSQCENNTCPLCGVKHDSQSNLVAHLGAKHRLVENYLSLSDIEKLETIDTPDLVKINAVVKRKKKLERKKTPKQNLGEANSASSSTELVVKKDKPERKICCPFCDKKLRINPVLQSHLFSRHFRTDCEEAISQMLTRTGGVCPLCPWIKWDNYSPLDWNIFFHFSRKHKIAENLEYSNNVLNQANVEKILARF